MKNFFGVLIKAYAAVAAYAVALVLIVVAVLFWTGALTRERVEAALAALRSRPPAAAPSAGPVQAAASDEREDLIGKKTRELQKLEDRVALQLAQLKADQETWEKNRKSHDEAAARAKASLAELAQAKTDAELNANVPILSKMDGAGIVSILKDWDDARFVRYLRALRPSKAAEVLDTVRNDPQFEEEFRRVPPDAPPGTKTRAERLSEEFKKPPLG